MTSSTESARQKLVNLLSSAASYNDKGFTWSGHSPEKVQAMQRDFQSRQIELAQILGDKLLGQELSLAIESGAAARDWSGMYVSLAEQALGVHRHGL